MTISSTSFPTPDLALRSSDPGELHRVRRFAGEQAAAASAALRVLDGELRTARSRQDRVDAYVRAYEGLILWRAELARGMTPVLGTNLEHDARRFVVPIRDGGPNYDRLGYVGRLRENPVWDGRTRTYRGGGATPAHLIMLRYGQLALDRFATEDHDGDTLRNPVVLPDGGRVTGNRLVRGAAARKIAADLLARVVARGLDATHVETGGEPLLYAVTAPDDTRERLFHTAMGLLADAGHGEVSAWQAARYLLYQAPVTKKGSDAVIRTFLVAAGTHLLGEPPVLEQDVDLRCIVAGQHAAATMPSDP
jgi:hypothetical protein